MTSLLHVLTQPGPLQCYFIILSFYGSRLVLPFESELTLAPALATIDKCELEHNVIMPYSQAVSSSPCPFLEHTDTPLTYKPRLAC